MRIVFRDDVLTYINLVNDTEEGSSEFRYSFRETSTITLKFEEKGCLRIVFEETDLTPIEVNDFIEFLIEDILKYSTTISVEQFCDIIISKFIKENMEVNTYQGVNKNE